MNNEEEKQYVFKFECEENWETLTETNDEKVRHCQKCDKNVYFAQNYDETITNAEKGNCVYSFSARTLGVILPPEGLEDKWESKKEPQFTKRILQFIAAFIIALPFVSFLPLYIKRTMIRSQTKGGDVIDYGWEIETLYGYLSDSNYFRPEQDFSFWLAVNLGLACFYAFVIALGTVLLIVFLKRRKG
ncbi:MAG: hypothetical protein ACR2F2_06045 [Pyrinomonadaceae bacterium]